MNNNYQEKLLGLTGGRAPSAIKTYLENLPDTEKGRVFELYLAELFKGNGWLAKAQGGRYDRGADILLYHPKTPSDVSLIVQAKNWATPLSFDDTKIELIKFEEKASSKYKCNQFIIISTNGYVSQAKDLQEFNMLLKGWDYVENLINKYDPVNTAEPDIELYAHNEVTYNAVKRLWEKDRSVAVIQATGTGKSYIIAKTMTDFSAEGKLVMAPSHYILQQQESRVPWALQSTTFMTYAKGANLTPIEVSQLNCKLIVLDEFHRCGADIWGAGVQKILNAYPDAHILGTSATPIRYLDNSRDMSDELFNSNVAENLSLAEAIVRRILPSPIYISALYTLDEEAENLLTALGNSQKPESEKKQLALEIKKARLDWEKTSGIPEILKKHLAPDIHKVIVFCRNEEHLDEMEAEVPRWFQKAKSHKWRKIYRVLSADSASDTSLEEFRNANNRDTLHLLFAIDMLNEGLHIPDVGAVILLRPTESPIIFYQQIGRCMQVDTAHIPTIFDFVNNFKTIKASNFLKDLETCNDIQSARRNSLDLPQRSLNVRIIDETKEIMTVFEIITGQIHPFEVGLEYLKQYVHENGHARVPSKHETSSGYPLGSWARGRRWEYSQGTLSAERQKALETITSWVWNLVEAYFEEGLVHLKQYVNEHRHSRVQYNHKTSSGYPLGIWVCARRTEYPKRMLSAERIKTLEAIPGWVWDPYKADFREALEHLKKYVHEYGHARVLGIHKTSSGFRLGPWVNSRRVEYKKGILSVERMNALEAITGWVWDTKEAHFEEGLEHLKQYVHEYGHAKVPKSHKTSSGFKLGSWGNSKLVDYKKGILPVERMIALEAITGWVLDPEGVDFQEGLEHLKQYVHENGHARVLKKNKTSSGFKLGFWVIRKHWEYKKEILPTERIKALEAITGWVWDPHESHFREAVKHLVEYIHENGHARVPRSHKSLSGFKLGPWISDRRAEYKAEILSAERIKALETITGWVWDPYEADFEEGLEHLKQYVHEYGHAKVPRSYKTPSEYTLGSWVNFQKRQYKKGALSAERIKALEAIPGWVSNYTKPA